MKNSVHLPTGHKFTLYRDEEDVYVFKSQRKNGPIVDGMDANEVVTRMIEIIPKWETPDELSRGYIANASHALKLCKEFEPLVIEALEIADRQRDAGK